MIKKMFHTGKFSIERNGDKAVEQHSWGLRGHSAAESSFPQRAAAYLPARPRPALGCAPHPVHQESQDHYLRDQLCPLCLILLSLGVYKKQLLYDFWAPPSIFEATCECPTQRSHPWLLLPRPALRCGGGPWSLPGHILATREWQPPAAAPHSHRGKGDALAANRVRTPLKWERDGLPATSEVLDAALGRLGRRDWEFPLPPGCVPQGPRRDRAKRRRDGAGGGGAFPPEAEAAGAGEDGPAGRGNPEEPLAGADRHTAVRLPTHPTHHHLRAPSSPARLRGRGAAARCGTTPQPPPGPPPGDAQRRARRAPPPTVVLLAGHVGGGAARDVEGDEHLALLAVALQLAVVGAEEEEGREAGAGGGRPARRQQGTQGGQQAGPAPGDAPPPLHAAAAGAAGASRARRGRRAAPLGTGWDGTGRALPPAEARGSWWGSGARSGTRRGQGRPLRARRRLHRPRLSLPGCGARSWECEGWE